MLSGVRDYCKGKDAPLLLYKTETSEHKRQKDLRLEDRGGGGEGCDWWEGACWDEWLYLEKPDAA